MSSCLLWVITLGHWLCLRTVRTFETQSVDQQLMATYAHFKSPKPVYIPARKREKSSTTGLDIFALQSSLLPHAWLLNWEDFWERWKSYLPLREPEFFFENLPYCKSKISHKDKLPPTPNHRNTFFFLNCSYAPLILL